ncbi:hypothetical protein MTY66_31330 [Mycolicibacterium sp. TY66]|nr:hypothetical protein MTY66_31330 [Mycolicibacterium sp. TY66]BCJ80833.1 hypothetical protein MTY81_22060 [Mycolicibacterium sp. TY81]
MAVRRWTALAVAVVFPIAVAAPAHAADAAIAGTTLSVSPTGSATALSDGTATSGAALAFIAKGTATATLSMPVTAAATITVRARGVPCNGSPNMVVAIDGSRVIKTSVKETTWTNFSTNRTVPAGSHALTITFTNDNSTSTCTRALLIDTITMTLAGSSTTTPPPVPAGTGTAGVPFTSTSTWRTALSTATPVDPNSANMVAYAARNRAGYANLVQYAVPIYVATTSTPRYSVACTISSWGPCPFTGHQIPIPSGAVPSPGSDGAMVVIDEASRNIYEFWQARQSGASWVSSWGAVNSLDGSGWGGASTGSGASRLAGVIRVAEIQQGSITHALALQTDNVCASIYRAPALKTDGNSTATNCIPEGARVRLNPSVNLASLSLTPAERTVATALQTYGAYVMDRGGSSISVSFERDTTAAANSIGAVYQSAGLRWDYDSMPDIPWSSLQVLAS